MLYQENVRVFHKLLSMSAQLTGPNANFALKSYYIKNKGRTFAMGLPASKFGQEIEEEEPTQGSLPSTPILTPKTKLIDLDPRSPSENIVRTPIQVLLAKHKETTSIKDKDLLSSEESCSGDNAYPADIKLKSIDPRSPTTDFNRTPIVIPDDDVVLPIKLHNKNLDNVRKSLETSPLARPFKKTESQRITSPKLLQSTLISPKPNENKRQSYVGLLETNLDYVETDLDKVKPGHKIDENIEDGYLASNSLNTSPESNPILHAKISEEYVAERVDSKTISSRHESECTNSMANVEAVQALRSLENLEIEDVPAVEISNVAEISSGKSEEDDDGLQAIVLKESPNELEHKTKLCDVKQDCQIKEETLRDFDKKLRNLIYEDKVKLESMTKDKKACENKSRVPLGTRNINTNLRKSISRLKVHDKPQKSNSDISRIPVFQIKKIKGKRNQQCENTPPRSMEAGAKAEKLQWDPDNTLII